VGLSQPGTGKTLAYAIPVVVRVLRFLENSKFDPRDGPLAVVLVPTHELADQVAGVVDAICRPLDIVTKVLIGGFSMQEQAQSLGVGFHVLIATPGRLIDALESRLIVLGQCRTVVIDEADKMVDSSFEPQIARLFEELPSERNLMMFSATMPVTILALLEQMFPNFVRVRIGAVGDASEKITQIVHYVTTKDRKQRFLDSVHVMKAPIIVFVNSREVCDEVANLLAYHGLKVASIHGGKRQKDRDAVVAALVDGIVDIVVATDILSRGIDIEKVQNIVNYEVPADIGTYVHRIGRTGRAGASGTATSFVTPDDQTIMFDLTRLLQRGGFAVPDAMLKDPSSSRRVELDAE
jgi:ATP-dependent RNA helicase DDX23/PRP28